MLRFRKSAIMASKQVSHWRLVHASQEGAGLVPVFVNNFNANISSQNGLQSIHALAILLTLTCSRDNGVVLPETIRGIRRDEMAVQVDVDIPVQICTGPKWPDMLPSSAKKTVMSLQILATQVVTFNRAYTRNVSFLSKIVGEKACSEWNGFNSIFDRNEGNTLKPAKTCFYNLLTKMKPSGLDTLLTTMLETDKLKHCGIPLWPTTS